MTEELISRHLYTAGAARSGSDHSDGRRNAASNFLLWQAAYSEYYASPKFWPDFGPDDLRLAVESYAGRKRRYGKL